MPDPARVDVNSGEDVVLVRQRVRELCQKQGFSLIETTKVVTAASELSRNTLEHGGGGWVELELVQDGNRRGLRMSFVDQGPGIENIDEAMRDGFTTGKGLGLGLGGSRRLVSQLSVDSAPGRGTRVTVTQWK